MKPLIKSSLDVLIHNLEVSSINGYPVDVKKFLSAFSMDVITSCAFGTRVNSMQNPENELVKKAKQIWGQNIKPLSLIANLYPSVMKYGSWFYPFDYNAPWLSPQVCIKCTKWKTNKSRKWKEWLHTNTSRFRIFVKWSRNDWPGYVILDHWLRYNFGSSSFGSFLSRYQSYVPRNFISWDRNLLGFLWRFRLCLNLLAKIFGCIHKRNAPTHATRAKVS